MGSQNGFDHHSHSFLRIPCTRRPPKYSRSRSEWNAEASVLQAQVALKMLVEQPDLRKAIFGKALKLCQDMDDQPLTEALHACQKMAEEQYAGRKSPPL
ncbi:unnamed protein product [Effrenium voratum]|nr:unnamed protein product [Effrenium voratum]